jgi:cell division septation protein DedD
MSAFSNIQTMGDVYVVQEGGRYKARLGVFTTRSEAQNLVPRVQSRGYNGAFIVEEAGGSATSGGVTGNNNPPFNPGNNNSVSGTYKIQLAALRNTRWFDPSKVNQYGTIEDFRRGDLTIKLLSGFRSLDEARRILPSVQRNGFSGAFIVQEVNGQLQKVR